MTKIEPWQQAAFIATLLVLTFVINSFLPSRHVADNRSSSGTQYYDPPPYVSTPATEVTPAPALPVMQPQPTGPTPEQLAEVERQKYLTRYLSTRPTPGNKGLIVVAVLAEDGKLNASFGRTIANRVRSNANGAEVTTSLFNQEFALDGLFAQVFDGSRSVLQKLELTSSIGFLLLARQSVEYTANPSLENVLTASMQLELVAIPVSANADTKSVVLRANGAGFKRGDARLQAQERLEKQIENDSRIKTLISP